MTLQNDRKITTSPFTCPVVFRPSFTFYFRIQLQSFVILVMTMTKPSFVLFAIANLAMAGPCKPESSTAQTSKIIVSSLKTSSSMVPIETSTAEATSAPTTDTYTSTNGETMTIPFTQIDSDTTLTTIFSSLSSSENSSELATTTTAAAHNPAECVGSIRIQHDHYIGISGGLKGPLSWNDCAQLCEDTSTCIAFLHSQSGYCWNAVEGDIRSESESQGWISGTKGTCPRGQ